MKSIFKKIIVYILELEARFVIKKYKPKIIAITGSVGKTSTKDAIYTVLSPHISVRKSEKSFNSEIGVPLTILGCQNGWNDPVIWLQNIMHGLDLIFMKNSFPSCLVIEVGADRPGDIKRVSSWLKSDIVVFTRIGHTPVHVEFFPTKADLVREKSYLLDSLKNDGTLVINNDDGDLAHLKSKTKGKVVTFGIEKDADVKAVHEQVVYQEIENETNKKAIGYSFKIDAKGSSIPVILNGILGRQHVYPILAASAVAVAHGFNMVEIASTLVDHNPPRGRMNLIDGIKHTTIIDDTYNSSPVAVLEALNLMKKIECAGRKIVILGDMMELGKFSKQEHEKIGEKVAEVLASGTNKLVTVGVRSRATAEMAYKNKMKKINIKSFETSLDALQYVKKTIKKGDVILVKGSQSMRMERIVEAIMDDPTQSPSMLVRQEPEWLAKA